MTGAESIFYWLSTLLMALSFFMIILSIIFKRPALFSTARMIILGAFATLTVFGILRWIGTDHPPFVTLFESMIASVWFILLIFIGLVSLSKKSAILLLPVSFIGFMMMGWSSSLPADATPLSAALDNVWLFIHASFATAGAAGFLIAAAYSIIFLLGRERLNSYSIIVSKTMDYEDLPKSILNFLLFGFILWGVMIASGSVWANSAWGRYWAWDPIELWSLISWMIYALLLHLRLAYKIPQRIFCGLTIAAALIVAFSLWGVGYIYDTIHTYG